MYIDIYYQSTIKIKITIVLKKKKKIRSLKRNTPVMIMITRYTQKWVKIKSPGVVKIIIS
jgi:hypothetical protein